ncbi:MAG: hypothetical protein KG003_04480 [Bacteroidetes bacterium]|nr:hypothetical protein [Bacteroidota bacterium]
MDIFAHTLWANAGARGANKVSKGKFRISPLWTGFWGVFPDFFAFTVPFIVGIYNLITKVDYESGFGRHHVEVGGFDIAAYLYQFSHSIVIWAFTFLAAWFFSKRPRYELLGWALHILIDIPSHSLAFYPTPFLFPISDYRFPYGVQWSNMWYMIINYSLLAVVWIGIVFRKRKIRK